MKANELRIGNFIIESLSFGSDKIIKVDSNIFNRRIDEFIPIPLTEEWLLKFGFECIFTHDDHYYYLESLDLGLDRSYQPFGIGKYKVEFKYVHQLQNLYFALTGEELTFKSE